MVPYGKTYALAISQGSPNPEQYKRSIQYLAGMAGSGLGMEEVGRIIHVNSEERPAAGNKDLLKEAFETGRRLIKIQ